MHVVNQPYKANILLIKAVILLIWNCLDVVRFDSLLFPVIRSPVNVLRTVSDS